MKLLWGAIAGLVAVALVLGVGVWLAVGPMRSIFVGETSTVSRSTEIVQSVEREQQVVLLSLGIQGVEEHRKDNESFFGFFDVPGTAKAKFILYAFKAKLGLEGGEVSISEKSDNNYVITIPDFVFIGHDEVTFKKAAESAGVLSWVTADVDELELATTILNDENREKYLTEYDEPLRSQAESYYRQLISGIDPAANVSFEFAGSED